MIEKIKNKLIKLLGGYTKKEVKSIAKINMTTGKIACINSVLASAESLYGVDANTWCDTMYAKMQALKNYYINA